MYISLIQIKNYRCFGDSEILFNPGMNIIIGENNAGKTALLSALGQIFNYGGRRKPNINDFFQGIKDYNSPPMIEITATLSSSKKDTLADKALVSMWLTKIEDPWEAILTYRCFFLPEKEAANFRSDIGTNPTKEEYWRGVERYLPKYISRIYGGNPKDQIVVDGESLSKFRYQFVDALRDVQTTMFSGQDPLLKEMLRQILDAGADTHKTSARQTEFTKLVEDIHSHIVERLDLNTLFQLVEHTGAGDSGKLNVEGKIAEGELLAALRLVVEREGVRLPVVYNGLGYNNLVYISLLLSKMDYESDTKKLGDDNAVIFPLLVVEEPEAHLHPALQYKLLKYLRKRIEGNAKNQQVFITTHSTHITSASQLDDIICCASPLKSGESPHIAYPGKVFSDDDLGKTSKKYVERFLDATKSNMLFSRSVVLVEGLAEQLVIPYLSEYIGKSFDDNHVALIRVDGTTFKHFLPIFGACTSERRKFALTQRLACVVDADPSRFKKDEKNARWVSCWPYESASPVIGFEYKSTSGIVSNLKKQATGINNIVILKGEKTFEYDLALSNPFNDILITDTCNHADDLRKYCTDKEIPDSDFINILDTEAFSALQKITDIKEKDASKFATRYLISVENAKGEHSFDLSIALREELEKGEKRRDVVVPVYIKDAITFVADTGLYKDQKKLVVGSLDSITEE